MLVSITGSESATVTEVALVESLRSVVINGAVEQQGNDSSLVQFDTMPSVEFVVRMTGQVNSPSPAIFQRQSPTTFRASSVIITVSIYRKSSHQNITWKNRQCKTNRGYTTTPFTHLFVLFIIFLTQFKFILRFLVKLVVSIASLRFFCISC